MVFEEFYQIHRNEKAITSCDGLIFPRFFMISKYLCVLGIMLGINLGIKKGNLKKTQKYNNIGWSLDVAKGEKI